MANEEERKRRVKKAVASFFKRQGLNLVDVDERGPVLEKSSAGKKPRKKSGGQPRVPTEQQEQVRVVRWLDDLGLFFGADQNQGKRGYYQQNTRRAAGMRSGVPDLIIASPASNGRPTCLEMKRIKGGRLSEKQVLFHTGLLKCKTFNLIIGYGAEDAIRKLTELGYCTQKPKG